MGEEGASLGWESNLTLSQRDASLHRRWNGGVWLLAGRPPEGTARGHAHMHGIWGTGRRPKGILLRPACCCGWGLQK